MAARLSHLAKQPAMRQLRHRWNKWTHLVTVLAKKKAGHRRITSERYHNLHQELLESCHECEKRFGAHLRPIFERMLHLVEPWVTPDAIRHADRHIRSNLLEQCYRIQRRLNPHPGSTRWLRRLLLIGLIVLLAGLIVVFSVGLAESEGSWSVSHLRYHVYRISLTIKRASFYQKFGVIALILTFLGILSLRGMRRY